MLMLNGKYLLQTSTGQDLSKWDIQPFIQHKRASMPKCGLKQVIRWGFFSSTPWIFSSLFIILLCLFPLKQLKDSILDGTHSYADFLGEKSGLPFKNGADNTCVKASGSMSPNFKPDQSCVSKQNLREKGNSNPPFLKNRSEQFEENLHDGDILNFKRDCGNFATDDMVAHENQDNKNGSCCQPINSKRMKLCASSSFQSIEQTSVPLDEIELLHDLSVREVQDTEKEGHDLVEKQVGTMEEGKILEDVCNEYIISKRCDQHDAFHKNQPEISSNAVMMPQYICSDETQPNLAVDEGERNLSVIEAKDDSEHRVKPRNGLPTDGLLYKISSKEEFNFSVHAPNTACPNVPQLNVNAGEVEQDHNMRCETEMLRNNDGYQDTRIDVTLKKHDFLSCQYKVSGNSSEIADWTEQNLCIKCSEGGGELLVCKSISCPLVIHENCLGSSAKLDDKRDFLCPFCAYSLSRMEYFGAKKKASLVKHELTAFIQTGLQQRSREFIEKLSEKDKYCTGRNADEDFVDKRHNLGQREENQRNQYGLHFGRMPHVPAGEGNGKEEVHESPTARGHEEQPSKELKNCGNIPCKKSDIIIEHQEQEIEEIQQEVLKEHITDASEEPVYETNINGEEVSEDYESIISNYV